jgi:hypothetical protein
MPQVHGATKDALRYVRSILEVELNLATDNPFTAASLVSENKILSHPASVDSIPTSANQEDHVSMGTIAAVKASDTKVRLCCYHFLLNPPHWHNTQRLFFIGHVQNLLHLIIIKRPDNHGSEV